MQNIIIMNQNNPTSGAYGIGVFVKSFIDLFKHKKHNIYLVELYSNENEFTILKEKYYTKISLPKVNNSSKEPYTFGILDLHVKHFNDSVVIFNYSTDYVFAKILKKSHPKIAIVGIIHSFAWVWSVNGNEKTLKDYIYMPNTSDTAKQIRDSINNDRERFRYLDKIVALSDDSAKVLHRIYNVEKSKIVRISNGLKDRCRNVSADKTMIKKALGIDNNDRILLYVGRLDKLKGVDTLVVAFNRINNIIDNLRLVIIGDGDLKLFSSGLGKAATRITFTGRLTPKEVDMWYQIADIGIIPTLSEECSFVGIEMMMHSLPIVSTNGRGIRNMFYNEQNSLTVNCKSGNHRFETELSNAIIKLLNSQDLANFIRKNARDYYLTHYRYETMQRQYLYLFEDINNYRHY